jgi:hypothetical protein
LTRPLSAELGAPYLSLRRRDLSESPTETPPPGQSERAGRKGDIKRDTVSKRVPTIHSRPAKKSAKRATFISRAGDPRLKIILYSKSLLLKTIEDTGSIDMALRSLLWCDRLALA